MCPSSHVSCVFFPEHQDKFCAPRGSKISQLISRTGMTCSRMSGWIGQGSTGTFMPSLGLPLLLMLLLSLVQPGSANAACLPAVDLHNLSQPQYQNTTGGSVVGTGLASFVQSFLSTIQPNPFPQGQCQQYFLVITEVLLRPRGPVWVINHALISSLKWPHVRGERLVIHSNKVGIVETTGLAKQ